jgi:deoxyribonuclease-4
VRIGIHTSISKSLEHAAIKAWELGANTFQIFSASPRMWKASLPGPDAVAALNRARERYDLRPLVIHDNYLINLAAADDVLRQRSIEAFRGELQRAILVGADYVVAHPGNYRGLSPEQGILRFLEGVAEAAAGLKPGKLMLLAECTVGAGAQIGGKFEELHAIRSLGAEMTDLPIGFCLDTCHLLAAGYDVATKDGLRRTIEEADAILGLEHVHVIHANDSKAPLGSHVDRHQHIGQGYIGLDGFRRILTHPKLRSKAFILETPREKDGDDKRNVETLKNLCRKPHTTTTRSS